MLRLLKRFSEYLRNLHQKQAGFLPYFTSQLCVNSRCVNFFTVNYKHGQTSSGYFVRKLTDAYAVSFSKEQYCYQSLHAWKAFTITTYTQDFGLSAVAAPNRGLVHQRQNHSTVSSNLWTQAEEFTKLTGKQALVLKHASRALAMSYKGNNETGIIGSKTQRSSKMVSQNVVSSHKFMD